MNKRPTYENQTSLERESAFKELIQEFYGVKLNKLPRRSHVDFVILQNKKPASFVELRCRLHSYRKYPTFMLAYEKWFNGVLRARSLNIPFYIYVQWEDAWGYLELKREIPPHWEFEMGGTYKRNDPDDEELVIYVPIDDFVFEYKKEIQHD